MKGFNPFQLIFAFVIIRECSLALHHQKLSQEVLQTIAGGTSAAPSRTPANYRHWLERRWYYTLCITLQTMLDFVNPFIWSMNLNDFNCNFYSESSSSISEDEVENGKKKEEVEKFDGRSEYLKMVYEVMLCRNWVFSFWTISIVIARGEGKA